MTLRSRQTTGTVNKRCRLSTNHKRGLELLPISQLDRPAKSGSSHNFDMAALKSEKLFKSQCCETNVAETREIYQNPHLKANRLVLYMKMASKYDKTKK